MRSIPLALLWETTRRGRFSIPGLFLVGNTLPLLIHTALSPYGVDPNDSAFVMMHAMFLPLMTVQFGFGILAAMGPMRRLYAVPISTASLAAWHLIPGAVILSGETALSLSVQNFLFGASYPVTGPALTAVAVWFAFQYLSCVSHRTPSAYFGATMPLVAVFCWQSSRYGGWFTMPSHYWTVVTAEDIGTLLLFVAGSWALTVSAVARDRCGERSGSNPLWHWIMMVIENRRITGSENLPPFASAREAQLWYEWRYKGIAMPLGVAVLLVLSALFCCTRFAAVGDLSLHVTGWFEGMFAGGLVLSLVAGLTGFFLGTTSSGQQSREFSGSIRDLVGVSGSDEMGHFLATRPVTSAQMANIVLQTAAKSTVLSWLLWALAFGAGVLLAFVTNSSKLSELLPAITSWYLPVTLLGTWIAMTNSAAVALSGRAVRFIGGMSLPFCFGIVALAFGQEYVSREFLKQVISAVLAIVSVMIVIGTLMAFTFAVRRGLLTHSILAGAVAVWFGILMAAFWLTPSGLPNPLLVVLPAFASLVVLPFATAPLAVVWNRHR